MGLCGPHDPVCRILEKLGRGHELALGKLQGGTQGPGCEIPPT